jgi:hypothetical protein
MNNKNNINNTNKYNYTVIDFPKNGMNYGNFISSKPIEAANKAFRELIQSIPINEDEFIVFTLLNNDTKKLYKYIGTRIRLIKPIHVNYNNNTKKDYRYRYLISPYTGDMEFYRKKMEKINNK